MLAAMQGSTMAGGRRRSTGHRQGGGEGVGDREYPDDFEDFPKSGQRQHQSGGEKQMVPAFEDMFDAVCEESAEVVPVHVAAGKKGSVPLKRRKHRQPHGNFLIQGHPPE